MSASAKLLAVFSCLVLLLVAGCKKQPNFGTMPVIEITYEPDPPPPTDIPEPEPEPEPEIETSDLPDPPATRTRYQVRLVVAFKDGKVSLSSHEEMELAQEVTSARRVGRFAAELWIGAELLERVRFDFPLLGADAEDESLERGLTTSAVVQIPNLDRATSLHLLDRKTREVVEIDWPLGSAATPSETKREDSPENVADESSSVETAQQ